MSVVFSRAVFSAQCHFMAVLILPRHHSVRNYAIVGTVAGLLHLSPFLERIVSGDLQLVVMVVHQSCSDRRRHLQLKLCSIAFVDYRISHASRSVGRNHTEFRITAEFMPELIGDTERQLILLRKACCILSAEVKLVAFHVCRGYLRDAVYITVTETVYQRTAVVAIEIAPVDTDSEPLERRPA